MMNDQKLAVSEGELRVAEPYIVDFKILRHASRSDREALLEIMQQASLTGLLHVVNHDLDCNLFRKLNEITLTYMETTPPEQKDKDSAVQGTGSFEGYKPRTEHEKMQGITNPVEEYNLDYKNTGSITRPKIFQDSESTISTVLDFLHYELTPRLLDLINDFCRMEHGTLSRLHSDSAEVAHFLYYHPKWHQNKDRKLAAYAGHTDIGSLTYLASNPIAGLQVYGPQGWRHVAYVPNSIVVNMGDAIEFMTEGRMNATLHRVIKPCARQNAECRPAFIYFIHPSHAVMSECLAHRRDHLSKLTMESKRSPGGPIDSVGLNRVISAISSQRDDIYLSAVDPAAWNSAKRREKVTSPPGVVIDYHTLVLRRSLPCSDMVGGRS